MTPVPVHPLTSAETLPTCFGHPHDIRECALTCIVWASCVRRGQDLKLKREDKG